MPEKINDTKIFKDFLLNIKCNKDDEDLIVKCYFILKGLCYYGNKKTILYASNIDEANKYLKIIDWMKKMLNIEIEINQIDYTTSKTHRIKYIKQFETDDKNQILVNVQILNEGIDVPKCDSVFIPTPNENITNLIQRMSRCNRILNNKKKAYVYLWCNTNDKIFKHLNKFIDYDYNIIRYETNKKHTNDSDINDNDINDNCIIKLLEENTNIDKGFIDTFFKKFKVNGELNFDIDETNVSKFLGISKLTLRKRLNNTFSKTTRYIEKVDYIRVKTGDSNNVIYMVNYQCFEKLAMSGDSPKSETVRMYFIKLREFITENQYLILSNGK